MSSNTCLFRLLRTWQAADWKNQIAMLGLEREPQGELLSKTIIGDGLNVQGITVQTAKAAI